MRTTNSLLNEKKCLSGPAARWNVSGVGHFEVMSDRKFNGILTDLHQMAGGDISKAGVVEITAAHTNPTLYGSSVNGGSPTVVADFSSDLGWYDQNREPS
jgi:hypothetical protein